MRGERLDAHVHVQESTNSRWFSEQKKFLYLQLMVGFGWWGDDKLGDHNLLSITMIHNTQWYEFYEKSNNW